MKTLIQRWKLQSPTIFKKFTNFGVTLMSAGIAATASPTVPNLHIPPIVTTLGGYAITAGFCIGLISKLTVKDPTNLS